mmetsp:Transcript_7710/g.14048  ORF Transcript_7710/g.14048 Transcript_7710/m.14048 type:complete len:259 (-) Transcript_7710:5-781(-)
MPSPVVLHVYDLNEQLRGTNKVLKAVGTGLYHGAVEVYGVEWSFGVDGDGAGPSGIFSCPPRGNTAHAYKQAVDMGATALSEGQVHQLLNELGAEWLSDEYHLLHQNCCDFSNEFCKRLGVGAVPGWLKSAAGIGATADDALHLRPVRNAVEEGKRVRGASEADTYKFGDFTRGIGATVASSANAQTTRVIASGKAARGCGESEPTKIHDIPRGIVAEVHNGLKNVIAEGKTARDSNADDGYKFGDLTRGLVSRFARR